MLCPLELIFPELKCKQRWKKKKKINYKLTRLFLFHFRFQEVTFWLFLTEEKTTSFIKIQANNSKSLCNISTNKKFLLFFFKLSSNKKKKFNYVKFHFSSRSDDFLKDRYLQSRSIFNPKQRLDTPNEKNYIFNPLKTRKRW